MLEVQFRVHPNQISIWKKQLLGNAGKVFGGEADKKAVGEQYIKELEAKVGQMTLENDFYPKLSVVRSGVAQRIHVFTHLPPVSFSRFIL